MGCDEECGPGGECLKKNGIVKCIEGKCGEGYISHRNNTSFPSTHECVKEDTCEEECGCLSSCVREQGTAKCLACGVGFFHVGDYTSGNITCVPLVRTLFLRVEDMFK